MDYKSLIPDLPRVPSIGEQMADVLGAHSAGAFVRSIAQSIELAKQVKPDHECVLEMFLDNGEKMTIHHVSARGACVLQVQGFHGDEPCTLFCHHSALQLECVFLPRGQVRQGRRPIGFSIGEEQISSNQS